MRSDAPLGNPDFGKAQPCECTLERFRRSQQSRLERYSNLGALTRLTFEALVPQGRSPEPANQDRFSRAYQAALAFAERPEGWLVFTGPSGCGKTHLAAAIVNRCINEGRPAYFMVVPDLLDHLRSTFSPSGDVPYDELFDHIRNAPLLALDDLGTQNASPWAQEKLYQLLNHRFNERLPTVVTTNLSLDEQDERLRTRLADLALSRVFLLEEPGLGMLAHLDNLALLTDKTFETFDPKGMNLRGAARQNLEETCRVARTFAQHPEGWLVLLGGHGAGKTHLAAAIGHQVRKSGEQTLMVQVADLLDFLRSTFSQDSRIEFERAFDAIRRLPLLILDDFGEDISSESTSADPKLAPLRGDRRSRSDSGQSLWAREKLYQIINYRYNARLPLVVTTALRMDQIETRISSRMADPRLSTVFEITAPDYRGVVRHEPPSFRERRA